VVLYQSTYCIVISWVHEQLRNSSTFRLYCIFFLAQEQLRNSSTLRLYSLFIFWVHAQLRNSSTLRLYCIVFFELMNSWGTPPLCASIVLYSYFLSTWTVEELLHFAPLSGWRTRHSLGRGRAAQEAGHLTQNFFWFLFIITNEPNPSFYLKSPRTWSLIIVTCIHCCQVSERFVCRF
jgi:hypothetical protein